MVVGWRILFGLGGLLLLAAAAVGWNQALSLRAHALMSRAELAKTYPLFQDSSLLSLSLEALDEAYQYLTEAEAQALAAEQAGALFLRFSPLLGWLPLVGTEVRAASDLVALALSLSKTGRALLDAARPLVRLGEGGPETLLKNQRTRDEILEGLPLARLRLKDATIELAKVEAVLAVLEELPATPKIAIDLQLVRENLVNIRALVDAGPVLLGMAEVLVHSAGFLQNVRELSANPGPLLEDDAAWAGFKSQVQELSLTLEEQIRLIPGPNSSAGSGIEQRPEVKDFIRLIRKAANGTEALVEAIEPLRELAMRDDFRPMNGQRLNPNLLQAIREVEPSFQRAQRDFADTRALLGSLRGQEVILSIQPFVSVLEGTLDRLVSLTQMGTVTAGLLPLLVGERKPQNILLIPQNADELRATGGFIVGSWLLTMDQGVMTRRQFVDNYDVDYLSPRQTEYLAPPEDMLRYQWAGVWIFLDANWAPDYPTTARMAREMYRKGQGIRSNAVFALDQYGMRDLVDALGPLRIPGGGGRITSANFLAAMEAGTDEESHRYIDRVLQSLIDRLQEPMRPSHLFELLLALERNLEQKHLLLFFDDSSAQQLVLANNWGGDIHPGAGDYLYVVDTNLGFDKSNRRIEREINYEAVISSQGTAEAQLEVHYLNNSSGRGQDCIQGVGVVGRFYSEQMDNCYWDYMRTYVPEGIQLLSASRLPWPDTSLYILAGNRPGEDTTLRLEQENGRTKLGSFFVVPRGEAVDLTFRYTLPPDTVRKGADGTWTYSLYVQKQPGTHGDAVSVRIRLPRGARTVYTEPQPTNFEDGTHEFSFHLQRDTRITVRFQPPG